MNWFLYAIYFSPNLFQVIYEFLMWINSLRRPAYERTEEAG
jgi:hypothetical protein